MCAFFDGPVKWDANEIVPGLFVGSVDSALDVDAFKEYRITHVLSLLKGVEFTPVDKALVGLKTIKWKRVQVEDAYTSKDKLYRELPKITSFINTAIRKKKGACLVHCWQGVSRSASAAIAYLIKYEEDSLMGAMAKVKKQRPMIRPNSTFVSALADWEENVKSSKSSSLQCTIN